MPKSQVSNSFCVKSTSGNTQITKISQLSISKVYKVLPDVKKIGKFCHFFKILPKNALLPVF